MVDTLQGVLIKDEDLDFAEEHGYFQVDRFDLC